MIIDIIIISLFIVAAIWGAHKGGVKIIASLASFVLAFVLAYTLAGTIGEYIKGTEFGVKIENAIESRITKEVEEQNDSGVSEEQVEEKEDAIAKIEQILGDKLDEEISDNKAAIAEKIVNYVFVAIGFLATFIIVKLALAIIFLIIELIFKLPVLNMFNKLIGCCLEVLLMLLKIWILLAIISFLAPLDFMSWPIDLLNESVISKWLYDNNIILNLIITRII